MICGDLNARTSNLQDFISDIDKHNIHDSVQTDTPLTSYDSEVNKHVNKLFSCVKKTTFES